MLNLWTDVGRPFGGFVPVRAILDNRWVMDASTPPWWSGRTRIDLRPEDTLVALAGQPYNAEALRLYAEAYARREATITLTTRRGEETLQQQLPLVVFSFNDFLDLYLADFLTGLGFWLLAVGVYRVRSTDPVNRVFAIAATLTAGALWLQVNTIFLDVGLRTRIVTFIAWPLTTDFVGVLLVHLTVLFPKPIAWLSPRVLAGLYLTSVIVAGLHGAALLLWWTRGWSPLAGWLDLIGWRGAMAGIGGGLLFYTARVGWLLIQRQSSPRLRRQLTLLALGVGSASPILIVYVVTAFQPVRLNYFWQGLDLRYLMLSVPLTFAFAILRYKTFRGTHPLLLIVFVLASSGFLANFGAGLIRSLLTSTENQFRLSPDVPLLGLMLLLSIFWSTQSSWRGFFNRLFQWERHGLAAVRQFGQRLMPQIDQATLPDRIAHALVSELAVEQAAVWMWTEMEGGCLLAGQAGQWAPPPRLAPPSPPPDWSACIRAQSPDVPVWLEPLRTTERVEVIAPLVTQGRIIGLLAVGKRWDEEIFDERDLEIIELIAEQATLFLVTAQHVDELRQVPRRIAEAQERERFKIAQELHDTIQQFLGKLPFDLEVSRANIPTHPQDADAILQECVAEVEEAAQTVREIRNSLAPRLLEERFIQSLTDLIVRFRARTGIVTDLALTPDLDASVPLEARHGLYRVVQQALDNVTAHAHARHVRISVALTDGRVDFAIVDDGGGFSEVERAQAQGRGSFGLKSMEARVTSLGGELRVTSAPGAGTQVTGWLRANH